MARNAPGTPRLDTFRDGPHSVYWSRSLEIGMVTVGTPHPALAVQAVQLAGAHKPHSIVSPQDMSVRALWGFCQALKV